MQIVLITIIFSCLTYVDGMYLNDSRLADRGQFNYMAYIETAKFTCGAVILNNEWLLTAGHCPIKGKSIYVELGVTNLLVDEDSSIAMRVKNFHIHENFSLPSAVADIAVLKLPRKINYSPYIQPIQLPKRDSGDFSQQSAVLAGFGSIGNHGKREYRIRHANFTVISNNECQTYEEYFIETLTKENICAVGMHFTESACSGDSGSPLVLLDERVVVGIASYIKDDKGFNDCEKGFPTVFTRVSSYLDWISEKTGIKVD